MLIYTTPPKTNRIREARFECSCSKTAMSSKTQSSSSMAQARRTVQQLRIEASIERVSKASSDLMRYCGEHAKNDPLLMGIPASENPFKDKKPCTVL
ncbi:guanine nucleotide-binding protein G(I)/G(S)/G(O) subunit gamma-12 isoform X2 [Betta splendens]|uniref:Guanine nucleotide-binding protein subunit gamma n=1 Tax=Betta splendens TaxID=158456 RepID=A0A9W2XQM6_BETSP|nr:guanine nucleotide-binding protein G(I)/G(S)/G(O) subunit gamma-12 isoform X2 [Betta splendens]